MRTICDACEGAVATFFCAADEAALCPSCDEKVHMCNKLASRHVRVGIADPSDVPRCDICEKAPAFFYCEVDGTSLCLQCDMVVHVGGKKTHSRYLLLRQRVKFPGDNSGPLEDLSLQPMDTGEIRREQNQSPRLTVRENMPDHRVSPVPLLDGKNNDQNKIHTKMFDLNTRPNRIHGQASNNQ